MKKSMKLVFAAIGLALCAMTSAHAVNSITYTVGGWQITITDLGLLPGGTASRALAINNLGQIVGLATDSNFELQRPIWDANTGAIISTADNFDPASTAVPEHRNDKGAMAGTESINQNLYRGVYWNSTGQAFGSSARSFAARCSLARCLAVAPESGRSRSGSSALFRKANN